MGWLNKVRLIIFDLDGTLYRGSEPIPHAVRCVQQLHDRGIIIRYLTNNSSQRQETFHSKLLSMGFPCKPQDIHSTATGLSHFLQDRSHHKIFVIGEPGLVSSVREAGIIVVNADESGLVRPESTSNPDAVVVGICKSFHYDLLSAAMQHIRSGSTFIATNSDTTYPLEGNRLIPGAGSLVAAIQACSGQTPEVLGKPNPLLIQQILAEVKVSPEQCLVVGDRLDTDIEAGRRAGCPCHLVLTGVTDTIPNPLAPEITWSQDLSTLPTLLE